MERLPSYGHAKLPSQGLARSLIRSLTRGTAVADGARFIHVGHAQWLAAQEELLGELAEDGQAETKFVRGAYGAGKSHFLAVVQDLARDRGWVTSHVECKADRVEIDRFETLYPRIAQKLRWTRVESSSESAPDHLRLLMERWTNEQLKKAGVRLDGIARAFDADARLFSRLSDTILASNLPADFARALIAFARAQLAKDSETTTAIISWMRGGADRVAIPGEYVRRGFAHDQRKKTPPIILRPIGRGTAHEAMSGLLWLIRQAGYVGLVLCIDEVEELAKLGSRKRQDQALQALREYVDHAGGEGGYKYFSMYLAATPEMFENEDYFPRYDALATRIQPVSHAINWRAPVIDLDKTPLEHDELVAMARRIALVHATAYSHGDERSIENGFITDLVAELARTRFRIAKPRLLARIVVDELERARQSTAYTPTRDIAGLISSAAKAVAEEASR